MKRLFALVLAVLMLGSVAAFADGTIENYGPDVQYATAKDHNEDTLNTPYTELWLMVDAEGQIDVTVPLVLVFKTDIDGGTATSPATYQITNNSSADLVVTNIDTVTNNVVDDNTNHPMVLKPYDTATLARDEYKVQLSVQQNSAGNNVVLGDGETGAWDLETAAHENNKILGGLFELVKDTSTRVYADMSTGKLSFITTREVDADGNDAGMDDTKGVHLLTVTYTVAIDTSDAIGEDVTTAPSTASGGIVITTP